MKSKFNFFRRKKALLVKVFSFLYRIGRKVNKLVVLEAPTKFHFEHFKNVLNEIARGGDLDVIVITPYNEDLLKNNIKHFSSVNEIPLYLNADIYISTEFTEKPYWFDCPSVYFGHGIGPKFDYAINEKLFDFDYVFSSYQPLYDLQIKYLNAANVRPVGLPILDVIEDKTTQMIDYFNLDKGKPTLIYAPSWCANTSKISDIDTIIKALSQITQLNIIVSPHPLLLNPDRCSGRDIFSKWLIAANVRVNTVKSQLTTLDLVNASSIVVSDISSILFEAMALNKKVIFDGNRELYEYSKALHVFNDLLKVCLIPEWRNLNEVNSILCQRAGEMNSKQLKFINRYLFNNGCASRVFAEQAHDIINTKT
jgi:CDP-Glycerol:Poly(glycerophosphate) glycerophosphotransferase